MSRRGDPYDNAVAESFFARLKTDRISMRHYQTREEAAGDIVDHIEMFYNAIRLHSSLDSRQPEGL